MRHELSDLLTRRSERGDHRGADAILAGARLDLDETPTGSGIRSSQKPTWILAFGTAAIVALVIGGATLIIGMLGGPGDGAVETDPPIAATTEATSTTAAPTTSAPAPTTTQAATNTTPPVVAPPAVQDPIDWYRVAVASDGDLRAMALGGPGLVAIGSVDDTRAIWTSTDGTEWARIPYDSDVFGVGDWSELQDIVAGPDGLVIVGSTEIGFERFATIWHSPDGISWERFQLDSDALGLGGPVFLNAVTHGPNGYVAVGWTTPPDEPWMLDEHVVLRSADGRVWESADGLGDLPLGGMWDVTAGGPGYVAVGVDWSVPGVGHAGVWTSPNGREWSLVDPASVECFVCDDIEQMGVVGNGADGLLATGGDGGLVWASPDGTEWRIIAGHDPDGTEGVWANAIVATGNRIVAVGGIELPPDPEPEGAAAWASDDAGTTWKASMLPESVFGGDGGTMSMHDVVLLDGRYVAVGEWNGDATVWVGEWNEEDES
jgi:hypothetical protein